MHRFTLAAALALIFATVGVFSHQAYLERKGPTRIQLLIGQAGPALKARSQTLPSARDLL